MSREYRYISGDSHLEIDSKRWVDRVPAQHRRFIQENNIRIYILPGFDIAKKAITQGQIEPCAKRVAKGEARNRAKSDLNGAGNNQ